MLVIFELFCNAKFASEKALVISRYPCQENEKNCVTRLSLDGSVDFNLYLIRKMYVVYNMYKRARMRQVRSA